MAKQVKPATPAGEEKTGEDTIVVATGGEGTQPAGEEQKAEEATAEAKVETKEETVVVTKPAKDTVANEVVDNKVKMVKVHAFKDHSCRIAGVRYTFEKNKENTVPEDVASILSNAHIVMKK